MAQSIVQAWLVQELPKLVAVVGGKHSGKTTIIEHLIAELKRRGYHVGAVKEMVRIPTLDTPAKETDRYTKAGAEIIVPSHGKKQSFSSKNGSA